MGKFVKTTSQNRKGSALVLSMIFVVLFSALAVSMASMSGMNVQISDNYHKSNTALTCAESGLEIMKYWLKDISISGTTETEDQFYELANALQERLNSNQASNISAYNYDNFLYIPYVMLDNSDNLNTWKYFSAYMYQYDADTIYLYVTGIYGNMYRTIRINYDFVTKANTVFDYGMASRGPINLSGNIELTGINVSVEASVYIESEFDIVALSIVGNSHIDGDVTITNPLATVDIQGGQASIGGETGQDAIDNHVEFGAPPAEFPTPDPSYFESYVSGGDVVDVNSDTSADATYSNVRIMANTNPHFTGNVALNGVVYVEQPNVVTFSGNTTVTGVIVGNGDPNDNSGTNLITFTGGIESHDVTELPADDPAFADLREETGTFLMAPGFALEFGGNFNTLNGAIAGNGIEFFGNAGGTIAGSIINYSDVALTLGGNSDLFFNRSGLTEIPAGFVPHIVFEYDSDSYTEITF